MRNRGGLRKFVHRDKQVGENPHGRYFTLDLFWNLHVYFIVTIMTRDLFKRFTHFEHLAIMYSYYITVIYSVYDGFTGKSPWTTRVVAFIYI